MVTNGDKWIRIFDIPDTNKHKKGFTIYKVISMLYPESCPDAITKVTVWKRYNDFRKLHREMKMLHKSLNLKDRFPSLPNATFFRRFDEETVQERRQCALSFLEYVALHVELFASKEFVRFFETSHIPADQINGNISAIRSELNLPAEPEYVSYLSPASDDEHTISDTDSISTLSSLSTSFQVADILLDPINRTSSIPKLLAKRVDSSLSSSNSQSSKLSADSRDSLNTPLASDSSTVDAHIYPTPPNTPGSSITDNPTQYIIEASEHINFAVDHEKNKEYENAFAAYKNGIDILLRNVKSDKNSDRKTTVRYKIEKYILRAEKLYNLYLSPEVKIFQELVNKENEQLVQHSIFDLYKYKVVKIIGSGMLVLHNEHQQLYFVKIIHKRMKYSKKNLILPENVPYMIKMHNYFDCEDSIILILQYCSGPKLWDYVNENYSSSERSTTDDYVRSGDMSDSSSDDSYSNLISNYANSRAKTVILKNASDGASTFEEFGTEEEIENNDIGVFQTKDNVDEDELEGCKAVDKKKLYQRKYSDRSLLEDFDDVTHVSIPLKTVIKWAAQLLLALEKLHHLGVICYDLHCNNLLIDENSNLLLTYMCMVNEISTAFISKDIYRLAPEMYSFDPLTPAVDWWSYGTVLYELLVGMPLKKIHPDGLGSYTTLKIPKYVSAEGRSLLKQLLACEFRERLGSGVNGTEDIKTHPFFNTVDWNSLAYNRET